MEDVKDLLVLCRLNLMEETVEGSPGVDRDVTMKLIDWQKRQCVVRIMASQPKVSEGALKRHIERNTVDGKYPPCSNEGE